MGHALLGDVTDIGVTSPDVFAFIFHLAVVICVLVESAYGWGLSDFVLVMGQC